MVSCFLFSFPNSRLFLTIILYRNKYRWYIKIYQPAFSKLPLASPKCHLYSWMWLGNTGNIRGIYDWVYTMSVWILFLKGKTAHLKKQCDIQFSILVSMIPALFLIQ